jgi:hypothetical protein
MVTGRVENSYLMAHLREVAIDHHNGIFAISRVDIVLEEPNCGFSKKCWSHPPPRTRRSGGRCAPAADAKACCHGHWERVKIMPPAHEICSGDRRRKGTMQRHNRGDYTIAGSTAAAMSSARSTATGIWFLRPKL